MATGRRALAVAGWSVLIAGSAAPASYAAPGLERRFPHAGGTTVPDEADHRRLASCSTVAVTAGYGLYTAQGSRNGKNLYISADGSSELSYSDRPDDRRWRGRRLPEELLLAARGGSEEDGGFRRSLGACSGGFWSLAPWEDDYPRLVVADCAEHPADIKVTTWSEVTCEGCSELTYSGDQPAVSCSYGDESTVSSATTSVDDSTTEEGTGSYASDSTTSSPPDSVTDDSVADDDDSCQVLDVGGRYPGLYTATGSYNERGDFYSEDLTHNIFFELDVSESTASTAGAGRRRSLQGLFGDRSKESSEEGSIWRGLQGCDPGYWIKTPTGGGYPFFAVAECAFFPQNIPASSSWLIIDCDGCDAVDANAVQTIECATGADAIVETPAPVGEINVGISMGSTLPGAGPSSCAAVTVTGVRAGGYTVVGEKNSRADLRSDDGNYELFFTGPAPALEADQGRRRLEEDDGMGGTLVDGVFQSRRLTTCTLGYWYITPLDARYPAYAVADCAYHPADIASTEWLYLDCETCEVETASPKPDVTCTGAPDNAKRGGSFDTPAPVAVSPDVTPAPVSSLISTCSDLLVTGDYSGNYSANGTYRGKMDFWSDDGHYNLYFELPVARRALRSEDNNGGDILPGDVMVSALEEAYRVSRNLALCTTGYWIITATSGNGYPVFGVPDCAEHPADIRGNPWLVASCETCGVQEAPSFVAPTVTCDVGATGGGGVGYTPSPADPANCGRVYVTGPAAGVYGQSGTLGSKGDFYSINREWNLYWVFYAGKPENRNRFRRGLSMPDGFYGARDGVVWSPEYDLALQTLAASFQGDGPADGELEAELQVEGASEAERRLEFCLDGFWLITPRGGGFPFYGTQNCANHPADVSPRAAWSVVECDGCGSTPINGSVAISCEKDGFTPPPSPSIAPNAAAIVGPGTPSPADSVGDAASSGAGRIRGGFWGCLMDGGGLVMILVAAAVAVGSGGGADLI